MLGQQLRKTRDFGVKQIRRNLIRETLPKASPPPALTKATHDALATVRIRRPGKRRGRRCCRQGGGGCRVGPDGLGRGRFLEISYSPSWKTDITPEKWWVERVIFSFWDALFGLCLLFGVSIWLRSMSLSCGWQNFFMGVMAFAWLGLRLLPGQTRTPTWKRKRWFGSQFFKDARDSSWFRLTKGYTSPRWFGACM